MLYIAYITCMYYCALFDIIIDVIHNNRLIDKELIKILYNHIDSIMVNRKFYILQNIKSFIVEKS